MDAALRRVLREIAVCKTALHARSVPVGDIPDLLQECRIQAWVALRKGTLTNADTLDRRAVRGWLRTVAERTAVHYHREVREAALDATELEVLLERVPSAEDLAVAQTRALRVADALAELERVAPAHHAVVTAHDVEDGGIPRIAADLGILQNTAWTRLRKGRAVLRTLLDRSEARERGHHLRKCLVTRRAA